MADSRTTKTAFAEAVKQLVNEKPFEKISIGEICDLCGMNRKSFYYHFHDKYELVIWIFETEFANSINGSADSNVWENLASMCEYFYKNKLFYEKILLVDGQNCFTEYFYRLCKNSFMARMRERLADVTAADKSITLYASFFAHSVYTWMTGDDKRSDEEFVKDMKNAVLLGAELAKMFASSDLLANR